MELNMVKHVCSVKARADGDILKSENQHYYDEQLYMLQHKVGITPSFDIMPP